MNRTPLWIEILVAGYLAPRFLTHFFIAGLHAVRYETAGLFFILSAILWGLVSIKNSRIPGILGLIFLLGSAFYFASQDLQAETINYLYGTGARISAIASLIIYLFVMIKVIADGYWNYIGLLMILILAVANVLPGSQVSIQIPEHTLPVFRFILMMMMPSMFPILHYTTRSIWGREEKESINRD